MNLVYRMMTLFFIQQEKKTDKKYIFLMENSLFTIFIFLIVLNMDYHFYFYRKNNHFTKFIYFIFLISGRMEK